MNELRDWLVERAAEGKRSVSTRQVLEMLDDEEARKSGLTTVTPEDFVGTAEAAAMLGLEKARIGKWLAKGDMPEPFVRLASGPVWHRSQIEPLRHQAESRRRRPREETPAAA